MKVDYDIPTSVEKKWDAELRAMAKSIAKELDKVDLFSNVGSKWKKAGKRHKKVSFDSVMERIDLETGKPLRRAANPAPGFTSLIMQREDHLWIDFDSYRKKFTKAFNAMLTRLDAGDYAEWEECIWWSFTGLVSGVARERLYGSHVTIPFAELEYQILLAGHLPAYPDGKTWQTCKFAYC